MILAFFKVDNSKNYERHTFDSMFDKPRQIIDKLSELSNEELRIYDINNTMDMSIFQDDYNDMELDGGWWCVIIKM